MDLAIVTLATDADAADYPDGDEPDVGEPAWRVPDGRENDFLATTLGFHRAPVNFGNDRVKKSMISISALFSQAGWWVDVPCGGLGAGTCKAATRQLFYAGYVAAMTGADAEKVDGGEWGRVELARCACACACARSRAAAPRTGQRGEPTTTTAPGTYARLTHVSVL